MTTPYFQQSTENFTYDPVGNRMTGQYSKPFTYGQDYEYDYENRLVRVIKHLASGFDTITFKYDPFGRRIEKTVETTENSIPTIYNYAYVYDNEDIILEVLNKTQSGITTTTTTAYVHGPGIDEPLSLARNGQTYYYHADGLGSITSMTDSTQAVVNRYSYDSFGMVQRGETIWNDFTYTGREYDYETGLLFLRERYHDPEVGRFISKDPIGFAGGDVNVFNYVRGNPVNYTDPLGLIRWGTVGKGATAVIFGGASVALGAVAAATPTAVGQVIGVTAVLAGSSTLAYGVAQVITGFADNEIPFTGTKEAIILGMTVPGANRNSLLGANELLDMLPDILARGKVPPSKIGEVLDYIQYGLSIGKSTEQIINELTATGLIKQNTCSKR